MSILSWVSGMMDEGYRFGNDYDEGRRMEGVSIVELSKLTQRSVVPAPSRDDLHFATDVFVGDKRFAVRWRTLEYMHYWQPTIRRDRPSGYKSEYEKIVEGYGDYMLYGYHFKFEPVAFLIISLDAVRQAITTKTLTQSLQWNQDGTTFVAFQPTDEMIVYQSEDWGCITIDDCIPPSNRYQKLIQKRQRMLDDKATASNRLSDVIHHYVTERRK